jgi:CBS domain-containing protein
MPSPAERLAASLSMHGGSARWLDAHVRSIMRAGVISVPSDASVRQVQRALVAHHVHAVLVVDAQTGEPVGWATALGVLEHMLADTSLVPAAVAVTEPAESIEPAATAEDALRRMLGTGCRRLLVRRHAVSPPEGVVSEMDLVELATPR